MAFHFRDACHESQAEDKTVKCFFPKTQQHEVSKIEPRIYGSRLQL